MGSVGTVLQRALTRRAALKAAGAIGVAGTVREGATVTVRAQVEATPTANGEADGSLTDVPGFLVGHATLEGPVTGCTVVLCPRGTVGGVEIRGGWTGTRDMDILSPLSTSPIVDALLFTGGSTFGLAAADGVMRWLEERNPDSVPQVPGAVVYDLGVGAPLPRPGSDDGHRACEAATQGFERGSVGAGTGTRVGALVPGTERMKGGVGSASRRFGANGVVGALAVVNSLGNVLDRDGRIVAGAYDRDGRHADAAPHLAEQPGQARGAAGHQTTLVAVATNADLTKTRCAIVAKMAQAGVARAVHPCFTSQDGDVVVVLAGGREPASDDAVGVLAAEAVADAIRDGVRRATSRAGIPDMRTPGIRSPDDLAWSLS